jgi:CRP-like cAMP-binding protein
MIIQKAELFKDLGPEIVGEISNIMVEESYEKGSLVFKAGDPANSFYLVVDGRVRLSMGAEGRIDYTASLPGEAFGWTGMVDRPGYVATAECVTPCKVIKVEKAKLNQVLEKDPASGMIFFKRLAGAVVQRLIDNYGAFLSEGSLTGVTYGSGQVMSSGED